MLGLGIGNRHFTAFLVLMVALLIVMDVLSQKKNECNEKEEPMKKQYAKHIGKSCWRTIVNMGTSYVAASLPT